MPKGIYLHKKGYKRPPRSKEWCMNLALAAKRRKRIALFNKKEWSKLYYLKNKERINAYSNKWRKKNPEAARRIRRESMRRWHKANPEESRRRANEWARNHHEYVLHNASLQYARRRGAKGSYTAKEWRELKARYKYTCQRCGRKEPVIKLTKDHIIPISKGGTNYIGNIQPLCKPCNCSKREFT